LKTITAKPAILGGEPISSQPLRIVKPCLPTLDQIADPLREILQTGNLTNFSRYEREFERKLSEYLNVPYARTYANATLGLILALNSLRLEGEVILPSFTFAATAHAVRWNGLRPVFVDILPDTFTLDPAAVEAAITPKTSAIFPVHIYGHPCEIDELGDISKKHHLSLLFDSAHAFGSTYRGQRMGGFGDAEVFSFHATKVFPVGEGGCVTTRDPHLAEYLKLAGKYGDPGDENTRFVGMNAKLQEFNAIMGLAAFETVERHIANRRNYANYLRERLGLVPGISFQAIRPYVQTNYQNFAILVDEQQFGIYRDQLFDALKAENIFPRKYFYPPLHKHDAYREFSSASLPVTELVSGQVLCLPFYSEMSEFDLEILCATVERIQKHVTEIRSFMRG
jgi:dTDP-4-amino-4,6-dideoxygalactose transaminase